MVIGLTHVLVPRSNCHKSLNVVHVAVQPPKTYMELLYIHAECECLFPMVDIQCIDGNEFQSKDPKATDFWKWASLCSITSSQRDRYRIYSMPTFSHVCMWDIQISVYKNNVKETFILLVARYHLLQTSLHSWRSL